MKTQTVKAWRNRRFCPNHCSYLFSRLKFVHNYLFQWEQRVHSDTLTSKRSLEIHIHENSIDYNKKRKKSSSREQQSQAPDWRQQVRRRSFLHIKVQMAARKTRINGKSIHNKLVLHTGAHTHTHTHTPSKGACPFQNHQLKARFLPCLRLPSYLQNVFGGWTEI